MPDRRQDPRERSRRLVTALEAVVGEVKDTLEELTRPARTSAALLTGDAGEIAAIEGRLRRLYKQLRILFPMVNEPREAMTLSDIPGPDAAEWLSAIRLLLDSIENRVAQVLPPKSSGGARGNFHGSERMRDGPAIRADAQRMSRNDVLTKWCSPGSRGVVDGQGKYTMRQVIATLVQDVGGHRRRRHLTGLSVAVGAETARDKT